MANPAGSDNYYVGQSPYGRIGTKITGAKTVEEALAQCPGIDFEVMLRPTMTVIDADTAIPCPNRWATVRANPAAKTDPEAYPFINLGYVAEKYPILQIRPALAAAEVLAGKGEIQFDAAGYFNHGARVWVSAKVGEMTIKRLSGEVDPIDQYLFFANGHDGKWPAIVGFHPWNIRCNNAIPMTMRGLTSMVKLRHVGDIEFKLAEAYSVLLDAQESFEKMRIFGQKLANTRMNLKQFDDFARQLCDSALGKVEAEEGEAKARQSRDTREKLIEELKGYFTGGVGNEGESLWDGLQSITEWKTHRVNRLDEAQRTRDAYCREMQSLHFGQTARLTKKAVQLLAKRAK